MVDSLAAKDHIAKVINSCKNSYQLDTYLKMVKQFKRTYVDDPCCNRWVAAFQWSYLTYLWVFKRMQVG